jgi:hypothetical protein
MGGEISFQFDARWSGEVKEVKEVEAGLLATSS